MGTSFVYQSPAGRRMDLDELQRRTEELRAELVRLVAQRDLAHAALDDLIKLVKLHHPRCRPTPCGLCAAAWNVRPSL